MGVLRGQTAIVTGASSGIGRAIALRFAQEGAKVAVADITETAQEGGATTCDLIAKSGGEATFARVDVSVWAEIDGLVASVARQYGRLDILVNNAATYASKSLTQTSEEEWARVMAVNLTGLFLGCKSAALQMLKQDIRNEVRGKIINITSQHGMVSAPQDFAYGVSKAAGIYMTRQIGAEYAKDNIICNAVAPGKILTGKPGVAVDPDKLDYATRRTPMQRFGKPEDVAKATLFLASDQSSYTTGVNLLVDGGWMAA